MATHTHLPTPRNGAPTTPLVWGIALVAGAALDLSASFTSDDALGLRRALSRLAATLALGALALCAALACALAGQLSLAQGWAVALPFVAGAQHMFGLMPELEAIVTTEMAAEKRPFCLPPVP